MKGFSPKDHVLILNDVPFTYEWTNVSLEGIVTYGGKDPFQAIEFPLVFSAYEEQEVWIYYSRNYSVSTQYGVIGNKTHYHYTYLIGTARVWNHPIEVATFQVDIPRSICPAFPLHDYPGLAVEETDTWFIGTFEFSDWIPFDDVILIGWTDDRSLMVPGMSVLPLVATLLGLSVFSKRRK